MTMHLAGHAYNTLRHRRQKPKYTKANIAKWQQELLVLNRELKSAGQPKLNLDQYIDRIHGLGKIQRSQHPRDFREFRPQASYRRHTGDYQSVDTGKGVAQRTENQKYTGTLVKGIATMHKSNAVPIIDEQQAKDISSMRR